MATRESRANIAKPGWPTLLLLRMAAPLQDTSTEEAVLQLRRDAVGFAFPVAKAEWPLQQDNRLDSVPLRPLRLAKPKDSNNLALGKLPLY